MKQVTALSVLAMMGAFLGPAALCNGAEHGAAPKKAAEKEPRGKTAAEPAASAVEKSTDDKAKAESETRGIELGKFSLRTHRAVPTQMNRVTFTLYATVPADEAEHFQQLLEHRQNKVRDQVIVATRLVPVEEYDDPEFTKFRRRILLRLRRTMPELMIGGVYVGDFNLVVENT
jgi:hypothetical protein